MHNFLNWYVFGCDYMEKAKNGDGQEIIFLFMLFLMALVYIIWLIESIIETSKKVLSKFSRKKE